MKKSKQQPRKKAASGSLESSSPPPPPPPAPGLRDLEGRRVLLGVSSSIAEHRALDLASALVKRGAQVQVVMTEEATRLIQPLAFEAITRRRVVVSLWERPHAYEMEHLEWTKWAEVFVVAPATANVIAKLALGIADDALTTFALAWRGRLLLAPAMNPAMFSHPALNDNLQRLRERGVGCIGPAVGATACGDVGLGRLAPVEEILARVVEALGAAPQGAPCGESSLAGLRVLVTSGPTREYLDPVRYLSNPSSGKMGHALAAEAARRGARVTLLHGPVALPAPEGLEEAVAITTAREMFEEAVKRAPEMDLFIFAAAVSDWRPAETSARKRKKEGAPERLSVEFVRNPDIALGCLERARAGALRVGFAAETHGLLAHAREKLRAKRFDLIVANDVTAPGAGFAADTNRAILLREGAAPRSLESMTKSALAAVILDEVEALQRARRGK